MAKIVAKTTELTHEQWLQARQLGIGGSDAAVVVGLSPYKSRIELWADKTGRMPLEIADNEAMRVGRDLEQYVADRFCEATGKKVRRRNAIFKHDEYDFIQANIDRDVIGENAGLECKTANAMTRCRYEDGEIPLNYLCQCRHYMNVMKYDRMYLAVLVMGKGFFYFEIDSDEAEQKALLDAEVDFWQNYVVPDVRPAADGSESSARALQSSFTQTENTITMFEQEQNCRRYLELGEQIAELEQQREMIKQTIEEAIGDNTNGITETYAISWKANKPSMVIDSKKLKAERPEIFAAYAKPKASSRIFKVNERKDK